MCVLRVSSGDVVFVLETENFFRLEKSREKQRGFAWFTGDYSRKC